MLSWTLDEDIRRALAGFLPWRSCSGHIFTFKQIMGQNKQWLAIIFTSPFYNHGESTRWHHLRLHVGDAVPQLISTEKCKRRPLYRRCNFSRQVLCHNELIDALIWNHHLGKTRMSTLFPLSPWNRLRHEKCGQWRKKNDRDDGPLPFLKTYILKMIQYITLSPCVVESHPTPGDSRGSSSPSRSLYGVSSHVADGGSACIPIECVQPSLSRSSSLSRSIHSPEHRVIFHPSCSHHVSKVASCSLCHPWLQCPFRFDVLDDRHVCLSLYPRYSEHSSPIHACQDRRHDKTIQRDRIEDYHQ